MFKKKSSLKNPSSQWWFSLMQRYNRKNNFVAFLNAILLNLNFYSTRNKRNFGSNHVYQCVMKVDEVMGQLKGWKDVKHNRWINQQKSKNKKWLSLIRFSSRTITPNVQWFVVINLITLLCTKFVYDIVNNLVFTSSHKL